MHTGDVQIAAQILHMNIDLVVKSPNSDSTGGFITLKCKDLRVYLIEVSGWREFKDVAESLENLSRLADTHTFYPFFYRPDFPILEDGWTAFLPESEYAGWLSETWRVTHVNREYGVMTRFYRSNLNRDCNGDVCDRFAGRIRLSRLSPSQSVTWKLLRARNFDTTLAFPS